MTTVMPCNSKCFICGSNEQYEVIASTNSFGPTDLDTRPPEMKRSTMYLWVHTCPVCGYTAVDVSDETTVNREFLNSEAYRSCDGIAFASDLAKAFYRHYMILMMEDNEEKAFWALLHAAWASDDKRDESGAASARGKAIAMAGRLLERQTLKWADTLSLIRADMLRRVSRVDELLEKYEDVKFDQGLLNQIIEFEKELARTKITRCMTVQDAIDYAEGRFDWDKA